MKINNTNNKSRRKSKEKETKSRPPRQHSKVIDYYKDIFSFKEVPIPMQYIERLAQDLVAWARDDKDALKISQFYLERGIHRSTFYKWKDTYEILGRAFTAAKEYIGNRRELGALVIKDRKYDPSIIMKSQSFYDEDWKNTVEWEASLRKQPLQQPNVEVYLNDLTIEDNEEAIIDEQSN